MNKKISNAIMYNVYPTSFYDSNADGIGDLKGITEKLEYIKQFADIVWINPVFKSPFGDGGYDIEDYYAIDQKFGTLEDVKVLTEKAHSLGLRVLFDLVVGHTSDKHKWFLESSKAEKNEYTDRYIWNDGVFQPCPYKHVSGTTERDANYLVNFFSFQPALNYGFAKKTYAWQNLYTDEVCDKLHTEVIKIIKFYMAMGIDGFRVDLANSIVKDDENGRCSCEVWTKIFTAVRKEYPDALFVAEWGQPQYSVPNGSFDIDFITHCYDDGYNRLFRKEAGTNVLRGDGNSFFRKEGKGEARTFFEYFLNALDAVKGKGYVSVVSGNHDLPRISMGRSEEELKTVFAFLLALPTVPMIYYGDEIGIKQSDLKNKDGGYCRTGARTPMQWSSGKNAGFSQTDGELYLPVNENYTTVNCENLEKNEASLINTVKQLVAFKREYLKDLSLGSEFELIREDYPLIFKRTNQKETFMCVVNPSEREYTVDIPENYKAAVSNNTVLSEGKAKMCGTSFLWLIK